MKESTPLPTNVAPISTAIVPATDAPSESYIALMDTFVDRRFPDGHFGQSIKLKVNGASGIWSLVRFDIAGAPEIKRATLQLYIRQGTQDSAYVSLIEGNWNEEHTIWKNRPKPIGSRLAEIGPTVNNSYVEIDLTDALRVDQAATFAILSDSDQELLLASREQGPDYAPRLVIQR
jgi:hypothetical protein